MPTSSCKSTEVPRFRAVVLWVGAVVLWCLRRCAQVLVNLLNSQAIYGVGRHAYLLGFFESSHSKRLELLCSRCNKSEHMKAECPEAKKDKYKNHKKEFHKKKNKAMVATWSDEDQSSDSNEESSSSEGNEICFMAGSSKEQVDMSFELFTIEDWQESYGHGECSRSSNLVLGAESHLKIPAGAIDGVLHCTGSDWLF
ncbi:hypothetical protein Taro_039747 [Colocasia esculenta]|uniref:CCHC-type domain-containing protein n=1 Tax=Colocasia esculenta TaxID=4460 RepID=A0A843WHD4_COLES|nr:hypothetical protein [Colocasia esculenta]